MRRDIDAFGRQRHSHRHADARFVPEEFIRIFEAIAVCIAKNVNAPVITHGEEPSVRVEAEANFQQAVEIARQQSTKLFELRATVSLSRLYRKQGKSDEA